MSVTSGLSTPAPAHEDRRAAPSRGIAGVSQKMLTQTLRTLERDGFVTRTVTPSVPVRVDYDLTPLGRDLMPVVRAVKIWAETHFDEVQAARDQYDAAHEQRLAGLPGSRHIG